MLCFTYKIVYMLLMILYFFLILLNNFVFLKKFKIIIALFWFWSCPSDVSRYYKLSISVSCLWQVIVRGMWLMVMLTPRDWPRGGFSLAIRNPSVSRVRFLFSCTVCSIDLHIIVLVVTDCKSRTRIKNKKFYSEL